MPLPFPSAIMAQPDRKAMTAVVRLRDHDTEILDRPATGTPARQPLVLIHALGLDRRMWDPVVDLLPDDRRVVAYDLRGHGRAGDAPDAATLHVLADDLAGLLDRLGIATAEVAGLSMGGAVAQTFAVDHPHRLAALDLIATAADPQPAYLERARSAELHGMARQVEPTLERWFTPDFLAADSTPVRYARQLTYRARVADWTAGWLALATLDTRPHLARITVPVRVVAGELDPSTPPGMMRALAAEIPGAQFVTVPGVRHLISLEAPHLLAAVLAG
jgi:3-oxoadipate enol-lactonase